MDIYYIFWAFKSLWKDEEIIIYSENKFFFAIKIFIDLFWKKTNFYKEFKLFN